MAGDLLRLYRADVPPWWRTLDVIDHTEERIHRLIRQRNAEAAPPRLVARRKDERTLVVEYTSSRRMCRFAKGIILGIAKSYREPVELAEPSCMLRGDDRCEIVVTGRPEVGEQTRGAESLAVAGRRGR